MKTTVNVPGVTCGGCVETIEGALSKVAGVSTAKVDLKRKLVEIDHDAATAPAQLLKAIEQAGYQGELPGHSRHAASHSTTPGVIDPVCGMTIDPAKAKGTSEYHGKKYHFCSARCKERFDADPAHYTSAAPAELTRHNGACSRSPQS
jgi:YHS domain-containing protein/copper chaperone CopZ